MTENPAQKTVPYSIEAEEAIIGAVLINPSSYDQVSRFLQAEDFYIHRHRFIWEAITRLCVRGSPVDFLTLTEELDQAGQLAEIGGSAYLSSMLNQVPTSLHAEAYAQIIAQAATRRRMLEAANQVAKLACDQGVALEDMIKAAEKAISSVSSRVRLPAIQPFPQLLEALYGQAEQNALHPGLLGVPTGLVGLDCLLQGLQPAELVIAAGRPGMGKTSLLLSIARHAAKSHGKHVAIISQEMSKELLVQRLAAQETGIEAQRIRSGRLEVEEWQVLGRGIESLSGLVLFIDDTPGISIHQVRTVCRQLHMEYRLDLVLVDYLQLLCAGERFENRTQEVSFITRQLKFLAMELKVPVLAAAQLSRAVEQRADKRPLLSDLRESGSIEMDADAVMFLYQTDDANVNSAVDVIVAKNRNGPTGTVRLAFRKALSMYENLTIKEGADGSTTGTAV